MPSILIQPTTSQVITVPSFDNEKSLKSSLPLGQDRTKTGTHQHTNAGLLSSSKLNGDGYEEDDLLVKMLVSLHQQPNPVMDESGLHLVSLSTERILLHLEDLVAVESLCQALWELGKRLKQIIGGGDDAVYGKAMRVTIYHCRAAIHYSQKDWIRLIDDCRKCLAIDLTNSVLMQSDSLLLQKVGLLQEHARSMLEQGLQCRHRRHRFPSSGSSSSIASSNRSSSSSSSSPKLMVCSFCSVEKRAMPVCAQCKIQTYCGIKCLKQDKSRHSSQCQSP
ncbi:hypothetical protein BC941DRAFT_420947 [Chlamydoabsidia padenii]|nr:hypothetical protein BC941DRAFT_420947 [Chlamydoabsidia padenii]